MIVHRTLRDAQLDRRLAGRLAEGIQGQSIPLTGSDGRVAAQIRKIERLYTVTSVSGSQHGGQSLELANTQLLALAVKPPGGRIRERKNSDLANIWIGHKAPMLKT
jgi:hypothetical protein